MFIYRWQRITLTYVYQRRFNKHTKAQSTLSRRNLKTQLRSTIHTSPSRKRSFSKTLFKPEKFSVEGKHFENGAFRKRRRHDNYVISSLNTNLQ